MSMRKGSVHTVLLERFQYRKVRVQCSFAVSFRTLCGTTKGEIISFQESFQLMKHSAIHHIYPVINSMSMEKGYPSTMLPKKNRSSTGAGKIMLT
ncbi:hypothetical protein NPIL_153241 [Nephila pilipes]|uniref:Uncharacterized protein n=1 Tax=Nephila pilipes TaxID=299642 RepID=A0A8X6P7W6_NEPPI|nr:hypothetical protein NPIL_153241 [Nephila pilipes]